MKQIKIASCAKDCKKLLEEKLQTTEGKFPVPKMFHAWTYHFSNIQEFSFIPHLFRCHYSTVAKAFCRLRNEIVVFQTKLTPVDCLMNSTLKFLKWKLCRSVIYNSRIVDNIRPPTARVNWSVHYQRGLHS